MRKTIYSIATFIGLVSLFTSSLFGTVLSKIRYLGNEISQNISGQLGPESIAFLIFLIFVVGAGIYTIFSD